MIQTLECCHASHEEDIRPLVVELTPAQQAIFSDIADELARNGFEAEPFGARSVAVKVAPAGVDAAQIGRGIVGEEVFQVVEFVGTGSKRGAPMSSRHSRMRICIVTGRPSRMTGRDNTVGVPGA